MAEGIHRVAAVLLVDRGRALLAHRRADRPWYPDCWDLVGGHIEDGETPEQTARRECAEELGVVVQGPRPVATAMEDPAIEMHCFVATIWRGEPVNRATDEHADLGWFSTEEVVTLRLSDPLLHLTILNALAAEGPQR